MRASAIGATVSRQPCNQHGHATTNGHPDHNNNPSPEPNNQHVHTHNATKPRSHTHGSSHACPSPNPTDGTAAQQRNATEPRVHSCVQTSPPNPGNRSRSNARITSRQTTPLLPTRQPTRERRAHKGGQTNKHTEQLDYGETKPNTHLIYSHSRPVTDAATNTTATHDACAIRLKLRQTKHPPGALDDLTTHHRPQNHALDLVGIFDPRHGRNELQPTTYVTHATALDVATTATPAWK